MDQTNFSYDQPIYHNTARPEPTPEEIEAAKVRAAAQKKTKIKILIAAGFSIFMIVLVIMLGMYNFLTAEISDPSGWIGPSATPMATQNPLTREFREKLEGLEAQINQADPSTIDFKQPPLNYRIELKEM